MFKQCDLIESDCLNNSVATNVRAGRRTHSGVCNNGYIAPMALEILGAIHSLPAYLVSASKARS